MSDVSTACSVSLYFFLLLCLPLSLLHCWLEALTKSQGTADILLLDEFSDPNPVGRGGKGEAGRDPCICSAAGEGCVPVLDSAPGLLWCLFEHTQNGDQAVSSPPSAAVLLL